MYKVLDVAKMFSVSKVTIYKKISSKKNELKGHIIKKKNITYLDDEAVEIIKNSLQLSTEKASGRLIDEELNQVYEDAKLLKDENDRLKAEKIAMISDQINELESTVRVLKSQIVAKENHIKMKNEILDNFNGILKYTKKRMTTLEETLATLENK
ncbi:MAG: hypothetical protein JXR88_18065 [Clostridia bacterium]|nr:hypothetical protein [Clostridia bacterium]